MKVSVYVLFDARRPNQIKYVGQSANLLKRYLQHFNGRDSRTRKWVLSVHADGGIVGIAVVRECFGRVAALLVEEEWIKKLPALLNHETETCYKTEATSRAALKRWHKSISGKHL